MDLPYPDILAAVRAAAPPDLPIYLVGGAVRDVLLRRPVHDLDFAVLTRSPGQAMAVARKSADALHGAFFKLDVARDIGRTLLDLPSGQRLVLDFAAARGGSLQADLLERDFSINAIAIDLSRPEAAIDPCGGVSDAFHKQMRPCSPASLESDPVRVWRGVRQSVEFGFHLAPDTTRLMKAAAPHLGRISPERLRDELFKLLAGPDPATALRVLELLGGLAPVLPEVSALKGVTQSEPHISDVFEHTLATLDALKTLLARLSGAHDPDAAAAFGLGYAVLKLGRFREALAAHLAQALNPERSLTTLLLLAALYHDTGKPAARSQEAEGRVRFLGHETGSADLAEARAGALRLSNDETQRLALIVRQHMRPHHLAQAPADPTRRAIYRYFRACGPAGIDIAYLSLADTQATYGPTLPQAVWLRQVDIARILLEAFWENAAQQVEPPALLDGHDVMRLFALPPGPQVGELLEQLREAQAAGEVQEKEQAVAFLKKRLA